MNTQHNKELFLFEQQPDSQQLVVIFSGVNAKSFMGYKLLKTLQCNKLFIRDPNKSWYHGKISGLSQNIKELTGHLKKICGFFETKNITFIGSSMGGYAALLLGIELKVGKIIAFGPQIYINKMLPNSPKEDSYISNKDLSKLINTSQSKIEIFIGLNELADLYHIVDIKNPNVIIIKLYGQAHNVMSFLHKLGFLYQYISAKVLNYRFSLRAFDYAIVSLDKNHLKNAVEFFYIQKKYTQAQQLFQKLYNKNPTLHIFLKYQAICFFHLKNFQTTVSLLEKAQCLVFQDEELHFFLGLSYLQLKKYQYAKQAFENALNFSTEKKLKYYIKLAISHRELKEYEQALFILKKSIHINSKNYGTYYQLAQIYKKQNKLSLAKKNLSKALRLHPKNDKIIHELKLLQAKEV